MRIGADKASAQVILLLAGLALCAYHLATGLFVGLVWLLPIIIAIDLGQSRDRKGWMWGLFLGWLGVLILAIMRPQTSTTPIP
jgi:hypothetical protein